MQYVLEFDLDCKRTNWRITQNWLDHVEFCLKNPIHSLASCYWCTSGFYPPSYENSWIRHD